MNEFVGISHVYLVDRLERISAQVAFGEKGSLPKHITPSRHFPPTWFDKTYKHTLDVRKRSNWEVSENKTDLCSWLEAPTHPVLTPQNITLSFDSYTTGTRCSMGAPVRYKIQPCSDIHKEWDWRSSAANQPCRACVSSLAKERSLQHRPDADHSFQLPIAPCAGFLIYRLDLGNTVTDISCQALLFLT